MFSVDHYYINVSHNKCIDIDTRKVENGKMVNKFKAVAVVLIVFT